jgi:hypothetical protein
MFGVRFLNADSILIKLPRYDNPATERFSAVRTG